MNIKIKKAIVLFLTACLTGGLCGEWPGNGLFSHVQAARTPLEAGQVVACTMQDASEHGLRIPRWVDLEGNTVEILDRVQEKEALFSALSAKNVTGGAVKALPKRYDPRESEENDLPGIRDQGAYGTCWAVAGVSAVETSILKNNLVKEEWKQKDHTLLSAAHMAWYYYDNPAKDDMLHDDYIEMPFKGSDGGNHNGVIAALASGTGTQLEKNSPYKNWRYGQSAGARYVSYYGLRQAKILNQASTLPGRQMVKAWICSSGAVEADLYFSNQKQEEYYYQENYGTSYANHEVVLVGWDDDYAKENFEPNGVMPKHNGAWIARNSYGTGWGDQGYFYISYEEPSLCGFVCYDMEERKENETCVQYDGAGGYIGVASSYMGAAANVFTAAQNGQITSVGISIGELNASGADAEIHIYRFPAALSKKNMVNTGDIVKQETISDYFTDEYLAAEQSVSIEYAGYQKVSLATPVSIKAQERYAIVISLSARDGHSVVYYPFEGKISGYDMNEIHYGIQKGQTFILEGTGEDAQWRDATSLTMQEDQFELGNLTVKAFMETQQEGIESKNWKIILDETVADAKAMAEDLQAGGEINANLFDFLLSEIVFAENTADENGLPMWEYENACISLQAAMEYFQHPAVIHIKKAEDLYHFSKQSQTLKMNAIQTVSIDKNIRMNPAKYFTFDRFDTEQDKNDKGVIVDIDKKARTFSPIGGSGGVEYRIDGNGHSISGMVVKSQEDGEVTGFAGMLCGAGIIHNLILKDSYIEGNMCVGAFAGMLAFGGRVEECTAKNTYVYGYNTIDANTWQFLYASEIGGIAGMVSGRSQERRSGIYHTKLHECMVYGGLAVGGILGLVSTEGSAGKGNTIYNSSVIGLAAGGGQENARIGVGLYLGGMYQCDENDSDNLAAIKNKYIFINGASGEKNYLTVDLYKPKTAKSNKAMLLFTQPYDQENYALNSLKVKGTLWKKKRGRDFMLDGYKIRKMSSDITLSPTVKRQYTINFYHALTKKRITSQTIIKGKKAQKIKAPKMAGYKFMGWYDVDTGKKFSFSEKVTARHELYPRYKLKK